MFRVLGHLQADINPLQPNWKYHPELDPAKYGLTVWDLDREFVTGGLGGKDVLPLRDILNILGKLYAPDWRFVHAYFQSTGKALVAGKN